MESTARRVGDGISAFTTGLIIRGVIGILFGIVLLVWPGMSLRALVISFGVFAAVDGLASLVTAGTSARDGERWWLVLHGIGGVVAGAIAFVWTDLSALALLYVIGTWALVLGSIELAAALTGPGSGSDRFTAGLHGVLGIAFGVVMWWRPGAGALALITLVATFAIVTGVMRIGAAIQLRTRRDDVADTIYSATSAAG